MKNIKNYNKVVLYKTIYIQEKNKEIQNIQKINNKSGCIIYN